MPTHNEPASSRGADQATRSSTLLVGTRKGLFTLQRSTKVGSSGWSIASVEFLGDPVSAGLVIGNTRWAALDTGHFGTHIWRDSGAGWEEVGAPQYPVRGATSEAGSGEPSADEAGATMRLAWTLEAANPGVDDSLWCGTIPGGLFHSADGGQSWTLNRPLWDMPERLEWSGGGYDLPGIHSVIVDPRNTQRVLVGVSCGGAWRTENGGASWVVTNGMRNEYMPPGLEYSPNSQDPHRLAQCLGNPDVIWNQHHNGCFKSIDAGRTWTEIEERPPSRFGFAVAAHPSDPDVAWFVPAVKDEARVPVDGRLVVARTTDGGKTFQSFGEGLPDTHAYDLIYRHALDVDPSGTQLAMASTTGSLWCSDSAGERWDLISANLPPVYFVRFV